MISLTPGEWADKYSLLMSKSRSARVLYFATVGTMAEMAMRIWSRGQLTDGSNLKYDEDYEVYIYKPPFPQKPNGVGKHGAKIKGEWAPSYLAAKARQGRADLPFELTGDLRIGWLGGPVPTPTEEHPELVLILMPRKQFYQARGLEEQKGQIFFLSDEEKASHRQRIADLYKSAIL